MIAIVLKIIVSLVLLLGSFVYGYCAIEGIDFSDTIDLIFRVFMLLMSLGALYLAIACIAWVFGVKII